MRDAQLLAVADPRNVDLLLCQLEATAARRGLEIRNLAHSNHYPLLLLLPSGFSAKPNLCIAAGFHGEEPGGCWGLLSFMETAPEEYFKACNLSFLPVVNASGIRSGERFNNRGENPNSGFCHHELNGASPSQEGRILLKNLPLLVQCARDGFLSLHEDVDCTEFYLYTFERSDSPGLFSKRLREAEACFFPPQPDGVIEGSKVLDGIIFRHCDGSFEDRLFHEGVPRTACTETPGKLDFPIRVKANSAITESFVRFHLDADGL